METNQDLVESLNFHLTALNELLSLGDLGLLKSDELYDTKHKIEDDLKLKEDLFDKIEKLKIEKAIPAWRNEPRRGTFVQSSEANAQLKDLHILLQDLIRTKGGAEQVEPVKLPELEITGGTINQAIKDAKVLLETQGARSAIDRVHTVLHGYLKKVCGNAGIPYPEDATLNNLLNELKKNHIAFQNKNENTEHILKSMANVFDKLNPIRNNASLAHPNNELLDQDEAMLIINTVNTLLSYIDSKTR